MIYLDDRHSDHGGHLYEESSHGDEGTGSVHFVGEESARGGYRDYLEGHEGGRGQSRIATKQTEEFEPTKRSQKRVSTLIC